MKGTQVVFESVDLFYYSLYKITLNRAGSSINPPSWLKNKIATVNPNNKDNECLKYAITVALNHERIKKDPQRISKINYFSDQNKGGQFGRRQSFHHTQNTVKSSNKTIKQSLLISLLYHTTLKKIKHAYKSKYNHKRDKYSEKLLDTAKKSTTDAIKTISKKNNSKNIRSKRWFNW